MKKEYFNIANVLTFSRIVLGILFFLLFFIPKIILLDKLTLIILQVISFIIVTIAIITDGLDGYFARKKNKVSEFGKHFDPLSDSIFFILVFFTFFLIKLMPWYFLVIIFLREGFMHIFLRPCIKAKGGSLPANIYGKIKTVFQCTLTLTILGILIIQSLLDYFKISKLFLKNFYNFIIIFSFISFSVITFLSVLSLLIYLLKNKD